MTLIRSFPSDPGFLAQLAERFGTPLFVYDARVLETAIERLIAAVPYPTTRFHFASVTNGNVELLRIFRRKGWGLHANTPGDLHLGLAAGFRGREIVFSGSNLSLAEFSQMLEWQVSTLNLDSLAQLRTLIGAVSESKSTFRPRIGFRLNIQEITGPNRIGISAECLKQAELDAREAGLKVEGIHFYRGTGTNETTAFTESIERVVEIGNSLEHWSYLDFGGGFGHPYRHDEPGFSWEQFGEALAATLREKAPHVELIIEPGRAVVAACGIHMCRVISTKFQGPRQIVGVDTSVANVAVLAVHGGYREIRPLGDHEGEHFVTDVCGNTTFSRDFLGRGCDLPRLKEGDLLVILDSGAYGYAMSSHFLHRPRPAEVLVENGNARLIRRREDYSVLLSNQVFEVLIDKGEN